MYELGGHAVYLAAQGSQIGRGEPLRDTARVLGRLLPRHRHPHLRARRRRGAGALRAGAGDQRAHRSVASVSGAGRSVHRLGAARARRARARRRALRLDRRRQQHGALVDRGRRHPRARSLARLPRGLRSRRRGARARARETAIGARTSTSCATPAEAARGRTCSSTDVWASMGEEGEAELARRRRSPASRVDDALLQLAAPDVMVLHCLPAHRGEEITEGVLEGPHSAVFQQAENRLHVQKAILERLLSPTLDSRRWRANLRRARARHAGARRSSRRRSPGSSSAPRRASCSRASTAS